jgi:GTP cyclohydrolase III
MSSIPSKQRNELDVHQQAEIKVGIGAGTSSKSRARESGEAAVKIRRLIRMRHAY